MTTTLPAAPLVAGRYRIERQVGAGGMAVVYEAVDQLIGRRVALKVFAAAASTPEALRAHEQEARTAASLSHPNLVTLLDAGVHMDRGEARVFLALELVEGTDLKQRLQRGPLALRHVAHLGVDLADALAHLHASGYVHRDVKPANVLLVGYDEDRRPRAKLGDFGIAVPIIGQTIDPEMTTGTAAYLSPEQANGDIAGPAGDVYSLGLVLLQSLTGRVAFPGGVVESALARLEHAPVVPESLPDPWRRILSAMTARAADDRPTAAEVAEVFTHLVIETEIRPESLTPGVDESARLEVLRRYDLLDSPPEGAFDRITDLAARTLHVAVSTVSIVDRDRIWFKSHHGLDADQIARDPGLCSRVVEDEGEVVVELVETGRLVHIPDAINDPSTCGNPLIAGDLALRTYAGVPLVSSDGFTVGALSVADYTPREFSPSELEILESLGAMVAHEMEIRLATRRIRQVA